ncbi:glycosyltransferase family 39 protein [Candidatus Woesearchaeota archaeon]|nr:glycosyltransferase family 39 protein [Candidatus Woesearchaeota archaeon]
MSSRFNYARLAGLVIVIGGILRFALAAISHVGGDACWHAAVSRFMALNLEIPLFQAFGGGRDVFWAPPLFHFVSAAFYKLFGIFGPEAAEFGLKMVSPLFGTLTLVFVYLIAKRLFSSKIAFFATIFMAFIPIHLYYSSLAFVEAFVTFFVAGSVYFMLEKRVLLSGIFFGLAMLSKQNALFTFPLLLLMLFWGFKGKELLKSSAVFIAACLSTGIWWFVRNTVHLGNPFWPFLYSIIGGTIVPQGSEVTFSVLHIFNPAHVLQAYLSLFGVPLGSASLLFGYSLPLKPVLLSGWFIATLIFSLPLIIGMLTLKKGPAKLLYFWIAFNAAGLLLYIMNLNAAYTRLVLPVFPALAVFWALGFEKLMRTRAAKISVLVFSAIIFCFAAAEFAKSAIASGTWSAYDEDFAWVRENTPEESLFYYHGQCLSYNIARHSDSNPGKGYDFVWINEEFPVEPGAALNATILDDFRNHSLVYSNENTGTQIYQLHK